MAENNDLWQDPEFIKLPQSSKRSVMSRLDPEFASAPFQIQSKILDRLTDSFILNPKKPELSNFDKAKAVGKGIWENLNPANLRALANPYKLGEDTANSAVGEFKTAKERFSQGRYSEAVGHELAGAIPFVGPAAAHAGENIGEGSQDSEKFYRGIGEGIGLIGPSVLKETGGLGKKIAPTLKEKAVKQYYKVLEPTKEKMKFASESKVAPGAIKRGIVAPTETALREKVKNFLGEQTQKLIDEKSKTDPDLVVNISPVINKLADMKFKTKANNTVIAARRARAIDEFTERVTELVRNDRSGFKGNPPGVSGVSFNSLQMAVEALDEEIGQGHLVTSGEAPRNKVIKIVANSLRNELNQATPNLANIKAEYSFGKNFQTVLESTRLRKVGQKPTIGSRMRRYVAEGAFAGELAYTHDFKKAAVAAGVMEGFNMLNQLINSTGWNTVSAVAKDRIATLLAEGKGKELSKLVGTLQQVSNRKGEK